MLLLPLFRKIIFLLFLNRSPKNADMLLVES